MPSENKPKEHEVSPINEQQLSEDEAFIAALYEELNEQNDALYSPSEMLDKRIISAAYKALDENSNNDDSVDNIGPKSSDPNGHTRRLSKKRWNSRLRSRGLATAASLTLVISLVIQQQADLFRSADIQPATTGQQAAKLAHTRNISSGVEEFSEGLSISSDIAMDEVIPTQLTSRANAREDSRKSARDNLRQVGRHESILPEINHKVIDPLPSDIKTKIQHSTTSVEGSHYRIEMDNTLSKKQFMAYLGENTRRQQNEKIRWSLVSVEQDYYQILLYLSLKNTRHYRLFKQDFVLKQSTLPSAGSGQNDKKFTLSDITLTANTERK